MRIRLGAPSLVVAVCLFGAVQQASASICGAGKYSGCNECDAQSSYSSCQSQCRTTYKLVYDTVL